MTTPQPLTDAELDGFLEEMEVDILFVQGKTDKEVAEELGLSEQKVESYRVRLRPAVKKQE